ncbi:hypothetical protein PLESTB_000972200 [Pleodorina starrii]|uniref:Uncharacterized protein n=1 Tax=Pleodorina starrii TaxID=330485 RepID=A0A9W6F4B2_9CHLO|nr:hypothetical protein PLESTM_001634300 [Pleodorina starrii]GLC55320.1 hypothetical protein PLESTB_000972200 [Pleodorina starrii]GLC76315.1 hypothetical protein PLESTF_001765700 [Pleodorina starrii]
MTPEDCNSLLQNFHDVDMPPFPEAEFTLPPDFTTVSFGKLGDGPTFQQPGRGPRGGKKPLRPRQQHLNTLEAELEQKLRDLKAAQAERERLQQRIKVLELILPVREHYAQLLKQRRDTARGVPSVHIYQQDVAQVHAQRFAEFRASASSGGLFSSGSEAGQTSDDAIHQGAQPSAVAAAAAACQRPVELPRAIHSHAKMDSYADAFTSGRIALFTSVPAHNRVPCQVLRHVSGMWKQWMREAGLILHAYDARPHDPGPQLKLSQLYDQLAPTFCSLRMEHPFLLTELLYVNCETGEREEPPPDSYWIPVAQGLRLSPEQVADAKAALALYNERTAGALEERRRLAAQLGSSLASLQGMVPLHGHGAAQQPAAVKRGQLVVEVDELAARLYRNVMVQGDALEVVKDFMGCRLFSLVQMVRAGVLSYPYFPDVIGILSSVDATPLCLANIRPSDPHLWPARRLH